MTEYPISEYARVLRRHLPTPVFAPAPRHTGQSGVDPDTYPTLAKYRESRAVRVVDRLSIGGGRWAGLVTLFLGFSAQSAIALGQCRTALGMSAGHEPADVR
jgi:hypothetical protein